MTSRRVLLATCALTAVAAAGLVAFLVAVARLGAYKEEDR